MFKQRFTFLHLIFVLLAGLVLVFIAAPLLNMALSTGLPELYKTATESEVGHSVWITLLTSFLVTLIAAIGSIPLAYLVARYSFPGRRFIISFVNLPIIVPHTAVGIALLGVLARNSGFGKASHLIGLDFIGTPFGIMAAMAYVSIPFLINAAINGFEAVPEKYEKVGRALGSSSIGVFFRISVPLAKKSILNGMVQM